MKKVLIFLILLLFLPASSKTGPDFECPWGECRELLVTSTENSGDGTLRAIVLHACNTASDEVIKFLVWEPIYLESPIVIPPDCHGHVYFLGKKQVRNVLDGSALDPQPEGENCLLRVETDGNYIEHLSLVGFQQGGDDENSAGIGLCLNGNYNTVRNSSFGVLEKENGEHGNDIGIYVAGESNKINENHISQNKWDGVLIRGNRNELYGNYIGRPYEDCSLAESLALSEESSDSNSSSDPSVSPAPAGGPPEDSENKESPEENQPPPARPMGGCSLMTADYLTQGTCPNVSNGRHGIYIKNGSYNLIGNRDVKGYHNVIQYNGGAGVWIGGSGDPRGNRISGNVFYRNFGLGIDLEREGVSKAADHLQAIFRSSQGGGDFPYYFALSGYAPIGTDIELYLVDGAPNLEPLEQQGDESGFGEGEYFLAHFIVQESPFLISLPPRISRGAKLTALTLDAEGNTSEFSKNVILELDTDRDGIIDLIEEGGESNSNPYNPDSDNDGLLDGMEDANQNGIRDPSELSTGLTDSDQDNLSDYKETRGDGHFDPEKGDTNPLNPDTDCDGLLDGEEDGNFNGIIEFKAGETDPKRADSDGDGLKDGAGCQPGPAVAIDNCPTIPNRDQLDSNQNGIGDVCEIP